VFDYCEGLKPEVSLLRRWQNIQHKTTVFLSLWQKEEN